VNSLLALVTLNLSFVGAPLELKPILFEIHQRCVLLESVDGSKSPAFFTALFERAKQQKIESEVPETFQQACDLSHKLAPLVEPTLAEVVEFQASYSAAFEKFEGLQNKLEAARAMVRQSRKTNELISLVIGCREATK
jgi:hypothetical protein